MEYIVQKDDVSKRLDIYLSEKNSDITRSYVKNLIDEEKILVNGKKIAFGEVVVVDENFGVRITSIVSNAEKIKSLK